EQVFRINYKGNDLQNYNAVRCFALKLNAYTHSTSVTGDIRVKVSYREEFAIGAIDTADPARPLVAVKPLSGTLTGNPIYFQWDVATGCSDSFPNYQIQILRLYNTDTSYRLDSKVRAAVDWRQALTLETGSGVRELPLTLAEGTGYYIWRVRPIGSYYEGGIADSRNWGAWSVSPRNDTTLVFTDPAASGLPAYLLYYEQFDDDKNWAYARSFTEGLRVREGMVFATPTGTVRQVQKRIASADSTMVSERLPDYSGRQVVSSVPVPVGERMSIGYLGYIDTLLTHNGMRFAAEHFDRDSNYRNPATANTGRIADYYSNANPDSTIPTIDGYPYTRMLLSTDGSERPQEAAGIGSTYRIGGGSGGKDRTARAYYSSVSTKELVSLFGDEAPADTSVYKVLTVDPNKVTSVAYMSKEGQIIATALQRPQEDTLLERLDESVRINGTVSDTVTANRISSPFSFFSDKRLSFTQDTTLILRYQLGSVRSVRDSICGIASCKSCDYHIRLIVHNVDMPDSSKEILFTLVATECGEGHAIDTSVTIRVTAGTYIIERHVETNTIDPATITSDNPYGASYAETYRNVLASQLRGVIEENDSLHRVRVLLDTGSIDDLYDYLGVNPDIDTVKVISTSCCTIRIPILIPDCGLDPCRHGVPDFEDYLVSKWWRTFTPGTPADSSNLNIYFQTHGSTSIYPSTIAYPNGKGAFNAMIANMLADTDALGRPLYSCKTLWQTWSGLVEGYRELATVDGDSTHRNPDFDLLNAFLDAAGKRYVDASDTAYSATKGYLTHAYKYIHYALGSDSGCETTTGYTSSWRGNLDSTYRWEELSSCHLSGQVTKTQVGSAILDCLRSAHNDTERDSCVLMMKATMESPCKRSCEDKYGDFYMAVSAAFAREHRAYNN
ncbi:MAG: hypothetical protein ABI876_10990, partial [Bacteroidota bacterium]